MLLINWLLLLKPSVKSAFVANRYKTNRLQPSPDLSIDYELRQSWFNRRCNNVDNDDDDDDGDEWQARK